MHVWASNHWLESDRFTATKSGQTSFSFFFLSSLKLCCVCSASHPLQVTTKVRTDGELGFLVLYTSFWSVLNRWMKHHINGAQALGLWTVFLILLGCQTSSMWRDNPTKPNAEIPLLLSFDTSLWQLLQHCRCVRTALTALLSLGPALPVWAAIVISIEGI